MKPLKLIKSFFKLCAASAVIASSLTISNCGGGISGDDNDATVRPKSLSGLELTLDNNAATIQFVRSAISESATKNGEFEEGAIRFDNTKESVTRQMLSGASFDVFYPLTTERITYKYTALNNSSGLLQIICANAGYNKPATPNPSVLRISYYSATESISTTNYFLTFASDGNTLTATQVRVAPNSLGAGEFDAEQWVGPPPPGFWAPYPVGAMEEVTYLIDSDIKIADSGAAVPVNYDVIPDSSGNLDSTIAVNTLDQKTIFFIPDNPAFDEFSGIHTKGTVVSDPTLTEEGDVLVYDPDNNVQIGSGNYSYDKIPGTDDAELVYYGGTGQDNTFRLNFRSLESAPGATLTQRASGFYEIQGGLQDGQTGFFYIRDDVNLGGTNN